MREIKFRAWNKELKKFVYSRDVVMILEEDGTLDIHETSHWDQDFENVSDEIVLLQYTGLKDKNGREIYEGDVVKGINFNMTRPQRFIGEVEYSYNGYTVKGVKQYTGLRSELNINFEVIGDVYRNPELLEAAE
ncbi:YopX family protein [Bacillus haynesii]|nr:YopX family protein [Bacillus haynesii]